LSASPEASDSGGTSTSDARTASETASTGPCNPLAAHPTKLVTLLGVGEDPSGALYVADIGGIPTDPTGIAGVRVFVPSQGSLMGQYVIGSGGDGPPNGEYIETFQSVDGSVPPRDLVIHFTGGAVDSMTLGPENSAKLNAEGRDGGARPPWATPARSWEVGTGASRRAAPVCVCDDAVGATERHRAKNALADDLDVSRVSSDDGPTNATFPRAPWNRCVRLVQPPHRR
jgi:hypothetical protein